MPKEARNRELARGINLYGKAAMMKKTGKWKYIGKGGKAKTVKPTPEAPKSRYYPVDVAPKPLKRRFTPKPTKLRATITPGTILILLSGRFRGKRVVFLKQLKSGLLLVTGPFSVNGVPLRRVNQAYVIATSTKVDVSGTKVPDSINDAYFKKVKDVKEGTEEEMFSGAVVKAVEIPAQRKADQKAVDEGLLKAISAVPELKSYLCAKFSLSKGDKPHLMKF
jgi:large subunit ribosomal protein L6e